MALDHTGMEILSRSECLKLLASHRAARVAFTRHALPAIVPVNYSLLGDDLVFATAFGSEMLAVMHENVIAFEVDSIEEPTEGRWSIVVVGVARHLVESDPSWAAARRLHLQPWIGHQASDLIRLSTDRITGRRVRRYLAHDGGRVGKIVQP